MKAIFVLDEMPEQCDDCCFCQGGDFLSYLCGLTGKEFDFINGERKDFCPLKPLPQRKKVGEIEKIDDFMESDIQTINEKVTARIMLDTELLLASGFNLCLDDILGEQE